MIVWECEGVILWVKVGVCGCDCLDDICACLCMCVGG